MSKIRNFDSFGAVFPHFCPDKREIWYMKFGTGERTEVKIIPAWLRFVQACQ